MDESSDLFRSETSEHDDVSPACCTLAIDNMNGADSRGREEKRQRITERDREVRVRETPEERESRLARRRQRPVILSGTYMHTKPLCSPGMNQLYMIPLFTSLRSPHMTHSSH